MVKNSVSWASVCATFPKQIADKRRKAREVKAGIDVVLDDVESEVVSTGKTPNGDAEQQGDLKCRMFRKDQARGHETAKQEQEAFGIEQSRILDVGHGV
ncbi:MAG: hypothetical protein ACLQNE_47245 [Thermoguttaceae bacterium]|jgi:hypothetical protein